MRRGSVSCKANRINEIAPNSKNPFAPEHVLNPQSLVAQGIADFFVATLVQGAA